jgi:hypothetical protein
MVCPGGSDAAKALGGERSSSVRQEVGEVKWSLDAGEASRKEAAQRMVAMVESLGLQPVAEPIGEDEVGVVCCMTATRDSVGCT